MVMKTKTMNKIKLLAVLGGLWAVGCGLVWADLTAIVTPGYQFPGDGSVAPTYDLLNQLGQPTIQIVGTVSGNNPLAAGSVDGTALSDTLPDAVTIGWNGASPRQLYVRASGLVAAYGGIMANGSNVLVLRLDTNYFRLATNSLANTNANTGSAGTLWLTFSPLAIFQPSNTVLTANALMWGPTNNAPGSNVPAGPLLLGPEFTVKNVTNSTTTTTNIGPGLGERVFMSTATSLTGTGLLLTTAHGFAATPSWVRAVLVETDSGGDNGYPPGDEVDATACSQVNSDHLFTYGGNSTNVFFVRDSAGSVNIHNKTNGSLSAITEGKWQFKMYARP